MSGNVGTETFMQVLKARAVPTHINVRNEPIYRSFKKLRDWTEYEAGETFFSIGKYFPTMFFLSPLASWQRLL
jgi:hypothetical protein